MLRWVMSLLALHQGVAAAAQEPARADLDFFEAKVRPVLVQRCFSCHSQQAMKTKGKLALDSRDGVLKGGVSGPAAILGKPDESRLVEAILHKNRELTMPPSGKLADHEIAALMDWVRRGVPFPKQGAKTGTALSIEEGRTFWSFQPVRPQSAPVKEKGWSKKPIDAFILAELEKNDLKPSPPAPPGTLIRRLYFDLIGLPPTPEEVAAFEKSASRNPQSAIDETVDKLLQSPHHGERWGRYWLDLVRYCDIGEPWAESKGQPHLYRDWVVKAFNDDLPYDQFVMKQLAADLMPNAKLEDRSALGFIGLSPQYWKELKLAPDVIKSVVAEEWEERIHTTASTFLGLTVACARCHDHKYDPIGQADYYALAGIFASTKLVDRALLPDEQAKVALKAREEVKTLEDQLAKLKGMKTKEAEEQTAALQAKIAQIKKDTPHYDAPLVAAVEDASLHVLPDGEHKTKLVYKAAEPMNLAMQMRGNPTTLGPVVPRRFLAVLSGAAPKTFQQGSGRLELAQAIVTEAAPLTARVIVNRVWKHHFGRGLVETPSDFGVQGDRPTHPQLLDDLAARFIQNGWSLRWLHREIVLSAAYQQGSGVRNQESEARKDPDNRLLWRMSRRRLDVEAWRDAMLAAAGTLDSKVGGPASDLSDAKNNRRTLYGIVKRRELNDLLRLHDFPDPTTHSAARVPTITPLQQLFTLNSPLLQQQAAALAQRVKKEAPESIEKRISRAYQLLYHREPTATQVRLGLEYLTSETEETWRQYAQVLLASNELLFVD